MRTNASICCRFMRIFVRDLSFMGRWCCCRCSPSTTRPIAAFPLKGFTLQGLSADGERPVAAERAEEQPRWWRIGVALVSTAFGLLAAIGDHALHDARRGTGDGPHHAAAGDPRVSILVSGPAGHRALGLRHRPLSLVDRRRRACAALHALLDDGADRPAWKASTGAWRKPPPTSARSGWSTFWRVTLSAGSAPASSPACCCPSPSRSTSSSSPSS